MSDHWPDPTRAICRRPGTELVDGLTTSDQGTPDFALALAQHAAYVAALEDAGLEVTVLDALPGFADAQFVEDAAVMFPELAVLTRPGHPSRQGEVEPLAPVLAGHRSLARIEEPGLLDGGDVLGVDRRVFVGVSARTNWDGANQLGAIVEPLGYEYTPVPVPAGLHLKSSVNSLAGTLLVIGEFIDAPELEGYDKIVVPAGEEYAANTLCLGDRILTPSGFPATRAALERIGLPIVELDMSEMHKIDGGLTCLSLRF